MFRVHFVTEYTWGGIDTKIFFDFGDGIQEEKKFFTKRENADDYLNTVKRIYVTHMICAYVRTSKRLIETGNREIYRTEKKIQAMVKCLALLDRLNDMKVRDICIEILRLEVELDALLPVTASPAHILSYFQLMHVIRFAKKEIETRRTADSISQL